MRPAAPLARVSLGLLSAFLFFSSAPARAFAAPIQGDGPTAPKASGDLEELSKQALATYQSALSLPAATVKWPRITVNGNELPAGMSQIVNLYFSGEATLLYVKMGVALDREIAKAAKAKFDVSHVQFTDAEFEKKVLEFKSTVERSAPDMTWEQYLAKAQQSEESFRACYRTLMTFEQFFFPKDPSKLPQATIDAVYALRPGLEEKDRVQFLEQFKEALRNPQGSGGILLFMVRQQLMKKIVDSVETRDLVDGLPPDVAMRLDERDFTTQELYARGLGLNSYTDCLRALQFAAIREAVRQAILAREEADFAKAKEEVAKKRAQGEKVNDAVRPVYWLSEGSAAMKEDYAAELKQYPSGPPFDHRSVVRFRRFPTMPIYRMFFQMLQSYRRATEKDRTLDVLKAHVENDGLFFSTGQAEVECIWYSTMADPSRGVIGSFDEAFAQAKTRAMKGFADIEEGARRADEARKKAKGEGKSDADAETMAIAAAKGFTFADILDRDSDYRDPQQRAGAPPPLLPKNRGRFGPQQRNPLGEAMHESEMTHLLNGFHFAEELFFRLPMGQVIGPVKGLDGYYIARVLSRTPGGKVVDLKDEAQRKYVDDDYVNHAFQKFVNEVMSKAKIEMKI
jgi:hypothetical protein